MVPQGRSGNHGNTASRDGSTGSGVRVMMVA